MSRVVDDVRCPFCGKRDIEYGLALCSSCEADIEYDVVERGSLNAEDAERFRELKTRLERAERDANQPGIMALFFASKRATKLADEMEAFAKESTIRSSGRVDRRLARGDATSVATFTRGDRSIDVKVYIPADENAASEFDVVLMDVGRRRMEVVKALWKMLGTDLSEAKGLTDRVPSTVLSRADLERAEAVKSRLESVGAKVELR